MDRETATRVAAPILEVLVDLEIDDALEATLNQRLPIDGPVVQAFRELVVAGVTDQSLVPKGEPPVRFGRIAKPSPETGGFSIDVVDMTGPGPGHTHPQGEVDLCFALEGAPTFDGCPEGWVVKPPGSWHVPTVSGGRMVIVYFLPGGEIRFEAQPGS